MIGSLVMGAIVGWIAGKLMNVKGGLLRNLIVGLAGSFVGGAVFGIIGFSAHGLIANLIVGIVGACIAIYKSKKLKSKQAIRIGSLILTVSICLSTVFLKQHSILDVFWALVLAVPMYLLAYRLIKLK